MVLLGINKRPTEYKEVDDKDWIREPYEKFNQYSRLSELVKSKEWTIDYFGGVVRLFYKDNKTFEEEQLKKQEGALWELIYFYDTHDGIDFLIIGINPDSIKYKGFSYKYQVLQELDQAGQNALLYKIQQKTLSDETNYNEGYAWSHVHESLQRYRSILISEKKCPECGKETVYIYFRSPSFTWESLCGTAGALEICPNCVKQVKYIEESRS
jgi:hypothetical protein